MFIYLMMFEHHVLCGNFQIQFISQLENVMVDLKEIPVLNAWKPVSNFFSH
jgi:hypothetical protein